MASSTNTAIIHDWLPLIGGAERVLESIHRIYPSPIYTIIKNEEALRGSYFDTKSIKTSFIQNLPFAKTKYRNYLPFFPLAIEQFDLRKYDIIISSSYAVAKGVLTNANQLHICYCHSPVRYAWDLYHQYLEEANLQIGLKGLFAKVILHYLRNWDVASINRVDYFIANSNYIARRIKKLYNREAIVIYPPVAVENFKLCEVKENFYLTASRMVPYKKIDLIVEAFALMPDKELVVIGDGPDFSKIKKKATANIKILGYQSFEVLRDHMQRAKAFVFAAEEDFGIIPVEAQACGTPVIAYGRGGALETVKNNETGLFFYEQTTSSLIEAIRDFEKKSYDFVPALIRNHSENFSTEKFEAKFKAFIEDKRGDLNL
ncbi:glycosyltransferase family 4 protein [Pontibacter arcticus]|uniref:Glycosyltransferase family 4 protein n=1 Tax=Pontibacter arcticus TaxID=2080288 RepID=A0A364RFQ8_9BACT|nr:glycosyltransferase family 4 protein [Pontibacter arcticus]RAU82996.1 glycosyltransferase family 4 protein [Pontibacter arcticus]